MLSRNRAVALVVVGLLVGGFSTAVIAVDVTRDRPENAVYPMDAVDFPSDSSYMFEGRANGTQSHGYVVWLPGTDGWGSVEEVEAAELSVRETGWYDAEANRSYWRRTVIEDGERTVFERYTEGGLMYSRYRGLSEEQVRDIAADAKSRREGHLLRSRPADGEVIIAEGSEDDAPRQGFTPTLTRYIPSQAVKSGNGRAKFVPGGIEWEASGSIRQAESGQIRINASMMQMYPQGITHEGRASLATQLFGSRQHWETEVVVTPEPVSGERPQWVDT